MTYIFKDFARAIVTQRASPHQQLSPKYVNTTIYTYKQGPTSNTIRIFLPWGWYAFFFSFCCQSVCPLWRYFYGYRLLLFCFEQPYSSTVIRHLNSVIKFCMIRHFFCCNFSKQFISIRSPVSNLLRMFKASSLNILHIKLSLTQQSSFSAIFGAFYASNYNTLLFLSTIFFMENILLTVSTYSAWLFFRWQLHLPKE